MTKLYVCGDSYSVYYEGMSWAHLLTQRCNFDLTHTGKSGSSNYRIFFQSLFDNFTASADTIAIISWSFPERIVYWNHKNRIKYSDHGWENISDEDSPLGFYETLNDKVDDLTAKELYKTMLKVNPTNEPFFIDTINYMIALDGFLTSRNIKHLFVSARQWPEIYNRNFQPLDTLLTRLEQIPTIINPCKFGYIDDAISKNFSHFVTKHLYQDGHEYVADLLYKNLIDLNLIS